MPGIDVASAGGGGSVSAGSVTKDKLSATVRTGGWAPSGAIAESVSRFTVAGTNVSPLSTGRLTLVGGIVIPGGVAVNTITFLSGTTALATGTNQWFALYDTSRAKLAVTADDTSTAWGTNTFKTLTLSATYTPSVDTAVYVGVMVAATTVPSLRCAFDQGFTGFTNVAPIMAGSSDSGLTNPASAPATAAAITAQNFVPYCYVS